MDSLRVPPDGDKTVTEDDSYLTTKNSVVIENLMLKKNMLNKICI
jgi:hypothetical protein